MQHKNNQEQEYKRNKNKHIIIIKFCAKLQKPNTQKITYTNKFVTLKYD